LISELIEERDFFGGFMEGKARGDRSRGDRAHGRCIVRVKDAIFYVAVRASVATRAIDANKTGRPF
jgi:hypothetical protein